MRNNVGTPLTQPMRPVYRLGLAVMLIASAGCSQADLQPDLVLCTDPRPEVCTMDYTPVCALLTESGSEQWKTYANACAACSDEAVKGYRDQACSGNGP